MERPFVDELEVFHPFAVVRKIDEVVRQRQKRIGFDRDSQFLVGFADCRRRDRFAGSDMPADGGVPHSGMSVLGCGAFLEQKPAGMVANHHVDHSVQESASMDLRARGGSDHATVFVEDVEKLLGHVVQMSKVPAVKDRARFAVPPAPRTTASMSLS